MKKSFYKFLVFVPLLVLTSCGYGLKEIYEGVPYCSSDFEKNYYEVWKDDINYKKASGSKITKIESERVLDEQKDKVFTRTHDVEGETNYFKFCEPNWAQYAYTYDKADPKDGKKAYGPAVCLGSVDNSFKYGVSSKLFDGQMFCNGNFQNSRTQVGASNKNHTGFGLTFEKECTYSEYFMLNFKCSVITDKSQNLGYQKSDLTLKLGFYLKNDTGYTYIPVSYHVTDVPTNSGDDHFLEPYSGRYSSYICFGFQLNNGSSATSECLNLNRLAGFSFEYIHNGDTYSDTHAGENISHAIMLYEVSLPHSTWH
ncbi:MAG: hypothetical protein K6F07_02245 [Bacilli bacterium]|nr:hypothetical protein [Bacilli bacterium]